LTLSEIALAMAMRVVEPRFAMLPMSFLSSGLDRVVMVFGCREKKGYGVKGDLIGGESSNIVLLRVGVPVVLGMYRMVV
jgi:hypothetical protein